MMTLIQDLRFAWRQLGRTPAFTITVLLTLALGIGANAAIFTLVNSVLLRNLPVVVPAMLVRVGDRGMNQIHPVPMLRTWTRVPPTPTLSAHSAFCQ